MSPHPFTVYPAVDIAAGTLATARGAARASVLGEDPSTVIATLSAAGARWIHLVDLDRARAIGHNDEEIRKCITYAHECGLKVQLSGGVRDARALEAATAFNPDRVNLACESLHDVSWLSRVLANPPCDLNLCLDVRGSRLISRGTAIDCGELDTALALLHDARPRIVLTDIDSDGAFTGPNWQLIQDLTASGLAVIASGGVRNHDDLELLRSLAGAHLQGVIVGAALHSGTLRVHDCFIA